MQRIRNKQEIASVERHVKNSIEYTNPNLQTKSKIKFPPVDSKQRKKAENMQAIQETINKMLDRSSIIIGTIKVDENFKGVISYRKRPIDWEELEKVVEFNNDVEFMDKFIKAPK